ncbi:MAG: hypothetical protein IKS31_01485 [Clostridia bacterium]|nr:hypothetical protein [Clostridia bacterium]
METGLEWVDTVLLDEITRKIREYQLQHLTQGELIERLDADKMNMIELIEFTEKAAPILERITKKMNLEKPGEDHS